MKEIVFYHGALSDSYEKQANEQGLTYGGAAEFVEKVGFGLVAAYIHGVITDSEYDKILRRFQQKILLKNLKPLKKQECSDCVLDKTDAYPRGAGRTVNDKICEDFLEGEDG